MFVFDRYTHPHLHVYWADCGMFDPDLHQFVHRIKRGSLELQQKSERACLGARCCTRHCLYRLIRPVNGDA